MPSAIVASMSTRRSVASEIRPLSAALVVALFVFCHPYAGLVGDSTIYTLRALADLDPNGLGRDPMVVLDGQMKFSLFPLLYRQLVAALGASQAAMLVAALASAVWLAALAALAHRLAPARIAWAMVACVAVLPTGYGAIGVPLGIAETSAVPRPFAEAAVMAGLAALLAERWVLAVPALLLAALVHPIMAEAGLGVAALVTFARLPLRIRIGALVATLALAAAALVAAVAGVPPLDRLVTRPDAAWLELMRVRSPYLFPSLWPVASFCPLIAQTGTIAVAAHRAPPATRRVLLAALAVAAVGLVVSTATAALPALLVIQAQTWRAAWLVVVLGDCALALCLALLPADGSRGRIILAALLFAWLFQPLPGLTAASVGLAFILEFTTLGRRLTLDSRHVAAAVTVVAVAAIWWASGPLLGYVAYLRQLPPDSASSLLDLLRNNLQRLPLLVAIVAVFIVPASLFERASWVAAIATASLMLFALDVRVWDQRDGAHVFLESQRSPPGLAALSDGRRREVLWLDDEVDAWFALGRPQYFSPEQGASIVFSRALASLWLTRAETLVALGLEPRGVTRPFQPAADDDEARVTQASIDRLCARPDAPGLVIVPRDGHVPELRDMTVWRLPIPLYRDHPHASSDDRRRVDGFGIVPCAPVSPRT